MKKVLLLGLALLGTVVLIGCDSSSGEKEYNYNDFKSLLAERKLSFTAEKATAKIKIDNKDEETREYTLDKENSMWRYSYYDEDLQITVNKDCQLDVISQVQTCERGADALHVKVGELYKFYATSNSYRIVGKGGGNVYKTEVEYKYQEDGLKISEYIKTTDLKENKSTEETYKFTYIN